jgi:hypothetical protein
MLALVFVIFITKCYNKKKERTFANANIDNYWKYPAPLPPPIPVAMLFIIWGVKSSVNKQYLRKHSDVSQSFQRQKA